jgi:PhnB protein
MHLNPYLTFNGQCEAAFKFYEKCFGGKIEAMITPAGTPAEQHVPPEWRNKIMHARLVVGDEVLMASDGPPDRYAAPKGIYVALQLKDATKAEGIFSALSEDGIVQMPLQQTFWAARLGMLVDRFGIPWMVNCEQVA